MQPETSMAQVERTVRKAIRLLMPDWQTKLNSKEVEKAEERRTNELSKRDGVFVSGDLLDYLYTSRIFKFVRDDPAVFSPMFGDEARTDALLGVIEAVRNTTAHGRELVRHERDLVAGIAGLLANLMVVWETTNHDVAGNYPVLTSVRDGLNRDGLGDRENTYIPQYLFHPARVEVGDFIEIAGSATEARGKGVLWHVGVRPEFHPGTFGGHITQRQGYPGGYDEPVARGANVRFRYQFKPEDVGERMKLIVAIRSTSNHHFKDTHDDERIFPFAINPPRDE